MKTTLHERLGFDPCAVVASAMAKGTLPPPLITSHPKENTQSQDKDRRIALRYKGPRRALPRHYSRDTLPKRATVRDDGYRFISGLKGREKDGREYWSECWLSPEKWEEYSKRFHFGVGHHSKHPVHLSRPDQFTEGEKRADGWLFVEYRAHIRADGTKVWYEKWASPGSCTGKKLLKRRKNLTK